MSENGEIEAKRAHVNGTDEAPQQPPQETPQENAAADAKSEERGRTRKRKSRWGSNSGTPVVNPFMPTSIPPGLSKEQEKKYLLQLRIDELTTKIRNNYVPENRSPSPEPVYNQQGQRLNTREIRYRQKYEEERHKLIQDMVKLDSTYKPPPDYKPPDNKLSDRVAIPQDKFPDINFMGLLIGPRGHTLKKLERETGAKIMIRGRGSVKQGKGARPSALEFEEDPLFALIQSPDPEKLKKAVETVREVISMAIDTPEGQNELKRMQLRELALLNGTLRDDEQFLRCKNCGSTLHRTFQCTEKQNFVNQQTCTNCGGTGHVAADCRMKKPEVTTSVASQDTGSTVDQAQMDSEYLSLMAELGEVPANQLPKPPISAPAPSSQVPSTSYQPPAPPAFSTPTTFPGSGTGAYPNMSQSYAPPSTGPQMPPLITPAASPMGMPSMGTPNMGTPNMGTPNMGTPNMGTPNMGTPNMGTPNMGTPSMGTPNMGAAFLPKGQQLAPSTGQWPPYPPAGPNISGPPPISGGAAPAPYGGFPGYGQQFQAPYGSTNTSTSSGGFPGYPPPPPSDIPPPPPPQ